MGRRAVCAAFGACTVLAAVALPTEAAGAATSAERPMSDPVMSTRTQAVLQRNTDAVFDGTRWFAVWAEHRGAGFDIMGARIEPDGDLPDGDGITISTGVDATLGDALSPSVAVDGNGQFLVAWSDKDATGFDVYAARVSANGRVLDPAAIPIAAGADYDTRPSVAWSGTAFLVAWEHGETSSIGKVARVTSAGAVTDLGPLGGGSLSAVEVAASGSTVLAVGTGTSPGIFGLRLDGSGAPLGTVFRITKDTVPGAQDLPTVAGGPNGWVVVWVDERNLASGLQDIYGARVAPDGTVQDPDGIPISTAPGTQQVPEVGVHGGGALVAWRDNRDGEDDVMAARLSGSGSVSPADGFAISATGEGDAPGTVVGAPGNGFAVFYVRVAPEAPYGGAVRGFVRTVSAK